MCNGMKRLRMPSPTFLYEKDELLVFPLLWCSFNVKCPLLLLGTPSFYF